MTVGLSLSNDDMYRPIRNKFLECITSMGKWGQTHLNYNHINRPFISSLSDIKN